MGSNVSIDRCIGNSVKLQLHHNVTSAQAMVANDVHIDIFVQLYINGYQYTQFQRKSDCVVWQFRTNCDGFVCYSS